MENNCHADPQLRTTLAYTDLTAPTVRKALLANGWTEENLPTLRTISNILNAHRYRLRRVEKHKIQKRTEFTDPIFKNVHKVNAEADADPTILRISQDTKASMYLGDFSRGGRSRCIKPVQAQDHDMAHKDKLAVGGILDAGTREASLFFTESNKTSEFMIDGLDHYLMNMPKEKFDLIRTVVINGDNGPESSGSTGKYLEGIVGLADKYNLRFHLCYYPMYCSKYNLIEHYWGGLEQSWNGYILDCAETVLKRAGNFIWKSLTPNVKLFEKVYEKGIKLSRKRKAEVEARLIRDVNLPKWDIIINPLQLQTE